MVLYVIHFQHYTVTIKDGRGRPSRQLSMACLEANKLVQIFDNSDSNLISITSAIRCEVQIRTGNVLFAFAALTI